MVWYWPGKSVPPKKMDKNTWTEKSISVCVCICVCVLVSERDGVREREREWVRECDKIYLLINFFCLLHLSSDRDKMSQDLAAICFPFSLFTTSSVIHFKEIRWTKLSKQFQKRHQRLLVYLCDYVFFRQHVLISLF